MTDCNIQINNELEIQIRQEISNKTHIFVEEKDHMDIYNTILKEFYFKNRPTISNSKKTLIFKALFTEVELHKLFQTAIFINYKDIIETFINTTDLAKLQDIIADNNYHAFRWAAEYSCIKIVKLLIEKVDPANLQAMIAADNYHAFRCAAIMHRPQTVKHLYMVAEDIGLEVIEFDKISNILKENLKNFNLDKFKKEVEEYRYEYNLPKSSIKAASKIRSFIETSRNENLGLTLTIQGTDGKDLSLILPKKIIKNILLCLIEDNGLTYEYKVKVMDLLHANKLDTLHGIKIQPTTKETFVAQVKEARRENSKGIIGRN